MLSGTLRELEAVGEDVVGKPDFGVSVEQSLVIVVGDSTAILDFTDHVAHSRPRNALHSRNTATISYDVIRFNPLTPTVAIWVLL